MWVPNIFLWRQYIKFARRKQNLSLIPDFPGFIGEFIGHIFISFIAKVLQKS